MSVVHQYEFLTSHGFFDVGPVSMEEVEMMRSTMFAETQKKVETESWEFCFLNGLRLGQGIMSWPR